MTVVVSNRSVCCLADASVSLSFWSIDQVRIGHAKTPDEPTKTAGSRRREKIRFLRSNQKSTEKFLEAIFESRKLRLVNGDGEISKEKMVITDC